MIFMYFFFVFFVLILNYSIYSFLKTQVILTKIFLCLIVFFFFAVILTKIYNFLSINCMPDGFGFFILLNFSWGIIWLDFIKKLIMRRTDIIEKSVEHNFLRSFIYLKIITIIITSFQLFLILSKTIFIFKS